MPAERAYYTPTTTTTIPSFGRIRGLSLEVLTLIHDGINVVGLLSGRLGKPYPYVYAYVRRLKRYGFVSNGRDKVLFLTPDGERLYTLYSKVDSKLTVTRQLANSKLTLSANGFANSDKDEREPRKQLSIERWMSEMSPGEAEVVVVDLLVKHYNETKVKFLYFPGTRDAPDYYSIAQYFGLDVENVKEAIITLHQEGRVMLYADRKVGRWKVGLYKNFVATLEGMSFASRS